MSTNATISALKKHEKSSQESATGKLNLRTDTSIEFRCGYRKRFKEPKEAEVRQWHILIYYMSGKIKARHLICYVAALIDTMA